ncbi:SAM-dependent methyltransferase [Streptomyces luteireticuli]|uniref:SAM-dependent methyltransferase n=1 Tax=Streptomyces luteireticuli TaxID=173858 RepID=A0ABN0YHQ4_9ACTN
MARGEKWEAPAIDVHTPSVARMYDWLLGGVENYLSDRAACAKLLEIVPSSPTLARNNRAFLRRVVKTLVRDYGVEQFIDHGSGLPTQENVHQVAQRLNPACRVVYVDRDPIVLAHGRTTLDENANTAVIEADMRDTEEIFGHPDTERLIKRGRRTAALFVSVLHCLPDSGDDRDPAVVVRRTAARLRELGPGNLMVICQLVSDDPEVRRKVTELMVGSTHGNWGRVRRRDEVRAYFAGFTVLDPGLVDVVDWRPETAPPPVDRRPPEWVEWGGVARL